MVEQYYAFVARKSTKPLMNRAVRSYKKLVELVEAGDEQGAADHWRKQMTFTIDRNDRDRPLDLFAEEV